MVQQILAKLLLTTRNATSQYDIHSRVDLGLVDVQAGFDRFEQSFTQRENSSILGTLTHDLLHLKFLRLSTVDTRWFLSSRFGSSETGGAEFSRKRDAGDLQVIRAYTVMADAVRAEYGWYPANSLENLSVYSNIEAVG